jgi:2',3'-cyclic-nucleotide 2'-phosphodiesterase (5'-nucleotidase family)
MRRIVAAFVFWLGAAASVAAAPATLPEAVVVIVGDQHSAYERTAQFVARVDRVKREHPGVPLGILINGDSMEFGNVVARRTAGAIDFAMFAALAQHGPTIINLGNHEPEFFDVAETVKRLEATGARVISGNLRNPATGKPYAPAFLTLKLGNHEATVVGVTTDLLSTYRAAIRPQLDLADPVVWAKENIPALLRARSTTFHCAQPCWTAHGSFHFAAGADGDAVCRGARSSSVRPLRKRDGLCALGELDERGFDCPSATPLCRTALGSGAGRAHSG